MPRPEPKALEHWLLESIKPDLNELARHDDEQKLANLANSLLTQGQQQAGAVCEDGEMVFGHGRYLAAKRAGLKTLEVKVYPSTLTQTERRLIRAAENFHRNELTPYRRFLLLSEVTCGNPTWQMKDIAEHFSLSQSDVSKILAAVKCLQPVLDAFRDGLIGPSDVYAISGAPHSAQLALLAKKLGGAKRDDILAEVKEAAKPKGPPKPPEERIARVRIPLAVKTDEVKAFGTVTVSGVAGAEVDLRETENLLSEALKAVRDAKKRGYGVKAAQAAWKDVAKVEEKAGV